MAEALTTRFAMHGARDAIASGLVHIEQQVRSLEQAVVETPGLAFDLAKTLVESVCRTVLSERAIAYSHDDDLPKLFRTATNSLPFLPAGASAEGEIRKKPRPDAQWPAYYGSGDSASYATSAGSPRTARAIRARRWSRCRRCLPPLRPMPSSAFCTAFTGRTGRHPRRPGQCTMSTQHSTPTWTTPTTQSASSRPSSDQARSCSRWSLRPTASTSPSLMPRPKERRPARHQMHRRR